MRDGKNLNSEQDYKDNSAEDFEDVKVKVTSSAPRNTATEIPNAIRLALKSAHKDELVEIAKFLNNSAETKLTMVFHTPLGEARCRVEWMSVAPHALGKSTDLLLVKTRVDDSVFTFTPATGAELTVSVSGYPDKMVVTCIAPPQKLYPGVNIMCFLPKAAEVVEDFDTTRE